MARSGSGKPSVPACVGTEARVYMVGLGRRGTRWSGHSYSLAEASTLDLTGYVPVRDFVSYPHKHVYDGHWWSSATSEHVSHESLLERDFLLWTDWRGTGRDGVPSKILAQPLAFQWPRGGPGKGRRSHVPDYALIYPDQSVTIVDVREKERRNKKSKEQFKLSKAACAAIGWRYVKWGGLPESNGAQVRFLSQYRQDRWANLTKDFCDALLFAFTEPTPLRDGLDGAALASRRADPSLLRGCAYHLLWTHQLEADLSRRLSDDTVVCRSAA